ncbi:DNA-3-methyladenine glycosylase family protein [Sphingopyxis granuli]|uniref:DNA-3-methyladenine glycosylase family protein n=1 Tax=Sphingopyxis granuli TaxID=267128 RepID=UPI001BAE98EB|nr:DNA-3-methyladenine glycosylase 2 family protein [Sphingopyxis granuli]QUM71515.1 DNA-3-methyladenine glycosylase 2 family protein [Sphingopyxis granuli]
MGLSHEQLTAGIDALAAVESNFARALGNAGYPEPRIREPGYTTLLRTIVGQQVSVAAANSIWNKLEAGFGEGCPADVMAAAEFDALRACGLSAQKQSYAKSLAQLVLDGTLDFDALPADDEEAIALLTKAKGIGRWSAEIYLLFAEGRPDIWPAGDLAVQEAVGRILCLDARPSEKRVRELAEPWRPHRGAAAIFSWHCYNMDVI